jgi:branched-chain amino acid transport system permease protein
MGAYGLFFVNGLAVGAIYALAGLGLVVLYRATGVLNLAHGATGAAGAMLAWQLMHAGHPEPLAWLAAIATATALSLLYGRLVAPRLAWREPVVKAVATLGFAMMILAAMNWTWIEAPRKLSLASDDVGVSLLGLRVTGTRLAALLAALAVTAAVAAFLRLTRTGLHMRALAEDRTLAALLGVPVLRTETVAWALSGVLAGLSGMLFADLVRLNPTVLTFLVIPAIAAAIVGRLEGLLATLAGGLLLGVVESMATLVTPLAPFRAAAPFVVAALVLLVMQRGRRLTFAGRD